MKFWLEVKTKFGQTTKGLKIIMTIIVGQTQKSILLEISQDLRYSYLITILRDVSAVEIIEYRRRTQEPFHM